MTLNGIVIKHQHLLAVINTTEKMKQVLIWEKGRMYNSLKNSEEWKNKWVQNCAILGICPNTVQRYVDYFHIINNFPRLIITGLDFSVVISNFTKLMEHLDLNPNLKAQLKMTLRTSKISAVDQELALCMASGGEEVPMVKTESEYWGFGFEVLDRRNASVIDNT
jgi:hypothetical protein